MLWLYFHFDEYRFLCSAWKQNGEARAGKTETKTVVGERNEKSIEYFFFRLSLSMWEMWLKRTDREAMATIRKYIQQERLMAHGDGNVLVPLVGADASYVMRSKSKNNNFNELYIEPYTY